MPWYVHASDEPPPLRDLYVDERDPGHTEAIGEFFGRSASRARIEEVDGSLCVRLIAATFTQQDPVPQREVIEARLDRSAVMMRRRVETGPCTALSERDIARQWRQLPDGQRDASVLFFIIINTVVDQHHDVLDEIRRRTDHLDSELLVPHPPINAILARLQQLSSHLAAVRDGIIPLRPQVREIIELREPVERAIVSAAGARWLRSLERDLTAEVPASLTVAEKRVSITMGNLHGERSESTNRTVALLTIVTAAFFIPTLVTGLYGMNVPLPGQEGRLAFWLAIGLTAGLTLLAAIIITRMGLWGTFRRLVPTPKEVLQKLELWPQDSGDRSG